MSNEAVLSAAEIFEKKKKLESRTVNEKLSRYEQADQIKAHLEEASSLEVLESRKGEVNAKRYIGSLERDAALIRQAVPFINPTLSMMCPLCPGALYLIGGISGTGKSTTAAAIAHALYVDKKKTFVISNEETAAKVVARVACAEIGVDFNLYIEDKVPRSVRQQVAHAIKEVEPFITVADDPIATTTLEGVEKLLKQVDESGKYSCVIIDFMQRVSKSIKNPTAERVQVLYNFKDIITDYAQHAKTPVVLFTQLTPLASDEDERNFETRIKFCKGLYEAASTAIEVIKVKGIPVSTFYMAKRRFGTADVAVSCRYEAGKFTYINKQDLQNLAAQIKMDELKAFTKKPDTINDDDEDLLQV